LLYQLSYRVELAKSAKYSELAGKATAGSEPAPRSENGSERIGCAPCAAIPGLFRSAGVVLHVRLDEP
jgi:hypothetical protein